MTTADILFSTLLPVALAVLVVGLGLLGSRLLPPARRKAEVVLLGVYVAMVAALTGVSFYKGDQDTAVSMGTVGLLGAALLLQHARRKKREQPK